jgi:chaperone required for assembly of F1-ATPase
LSPLKAFEAAALDNLWSLAEWGEDEEARARLDRQLKDFEALGRFIEALAP